jgi:putative Mg2+ transporter-C (MgtC) family protein
VSGLTTAAAIWLAALLGVAAGAGAYVPVIAALVLGLIAIACGGPFEKWFRRVTGTTSHPPADEPDE